MPDLFNCFSPYFGEGAPSEYKECVLCTIWEIAQEIGSPFKPFGMGFYPVVLRSMDPSCDDNVIQHACSCLQQILLLCDLPESTANEIWQVVNSLMNQDPSRSLLFESLYGLISQLVLSFPNLRNVDQVGFV